MCIFAAYSKILTGVNFVHVNGVLGAEYSFFNSIKNADPGGVPHSATSHPVLHWLLRSHIWTL